MANLDIQLIKDKNWPRSAAFIVSESIISALKGAKKCNVMLTGGRTAAMLYLAWSDLPEFKLLKNVNFYFSDERCLSLNHPHSNYSLVMRTLFRNGIPHGCKLVYMKPNSVDFNKSALSYEKKLPGYLDVVLLTAGDDGHIASLFPGAQALCELERKVVLASSPNHPYDRLTISPRIFKNMGKVFVLAFGQQKASILRKAQFGNDEFCRLPVGLVIGATWLTDINC